MGWRTGWLMDITLALRMTGGDGHHGGAMVVPFGNAHRLKVRGRIHYDGHRVATVVGPARWPSWRWRAWRAGSRSVEAGEGLADAEDEFAIDELLLASGSVAESGAGQAVDFSQCALG